MIKKIALVLMLIAILITFSLTIQESKEYLDCFSKDYFVSKTFRETGSKNIVTGIYLDYRLFDSIFEAGIFLVVVSGIIFMSKKDEEVL
jgi:multicomponent Na+:H+ antiporter subunit B